MSPARRLDLLTVALDDAAQDAPHVYRPIYAAAWSPEECAAYHVFYTSAHRAWSAAAATRQSRLWTEIGQMAVERTVA